jgi:hypothetical protein
MHGLAMAAPRAVPRHATPRHSPTEVRRRKKKHERASFALPMGGFSFFIFQLGTPS